MASFLSETRGLPGLNCGFPWNTYVIVHMRQTKQRKLSVLLSVGGTAMITVDVEPRVLSKCFFSQSHPHDLPITRICVFDEIPFWVNIKGLFYMCTLKCGIPECNYVHVMAHS